MNFYRQLAKSQIYRIDRLLWCLVFFPILVDFFFGKFFLLFTESFALHWFFPPSYLCTLAGNNSVAGSFYFAFFPNEYTCMCNMDFVTAALRCFVAYLCTMSLIISHALQTYIISIHVRREKISVYHAWLCMRRKHLILDGRHGHNFRSNDNFLLSWKCRFKYYFPIIYIFLEFIRSKL